MTMDDSRRSARITDEAYRQFFRLHASGIALVTAYGVDGPAGAVATSFCALSRRPPMLLVCLTHRSRTGAAIRSGGHFAVQLLEERQHALCKRFAEAAEDKRKPFAGLPLTSRREGPLFPGTLGWALCALGEEFVAGDHTIITGHILEAHHERGRPLVWQANDYRSLAPDN